MRIVLPFLRSPHNYDRDAASDETGLSCLDPSLAKQAFAEEADINTIVKRFGISGEVPQGVETPTYGDFTGVFDFHSAVNVVAAAHESFDAMPAEVRFRFHNDPGAFMDFVHNEANRAEAISLGLVLPPPPAPVADAAMGVSTGSGAEPKVAPEGAKHSSST